MSNKKLGILGMGRIGRAVAQRARGFGMEIHYHNRTQLDDNDACGAVFHNTIESLLEVSEFLSLHCPATQQTNKMINGIM